MSHDPSPTTAPTQPSLDVGPVQDENGQVWLVDPGPYVCPRDTETHHRLPVDPRQLEFAGVRPGAGWQRREHDDDHEPCEYLRPAQLDLSVWGIWKRRGRWSTWGTDDEPSAADRTMAALRNQCVNVQDMGQWENMSLPSALRGKRWRGPDGKLYRLTKTEREIFAAVVQAFLRDTCGVYEDEPVLAADCDASTRAFRYALNGRTWETQDGASSRPGLERLGLVRVVPTFKRGTDGRPSDESWLWLRLGPVAEALIGVASFGYRTSRRPPRRSGIRVGEARAARAQLNREARATRRERAGEQWRQRVDGRRRAPSLPPAEPPRPAPAAGETPAPTVARAKRAPTPGGAGASPRPRADHGGRHNVPPTPPRPLTGAVGAGVGTGGQPPEPPGVGARFARATVGAGVSPAAGDTRAGPNAVGGPCGLALEGASGVPPAAAAKPAAAVERPAFALGDRLAQLAPALAAGASAQLRMALGCELDPCPGCRGRGHVRSPSGDTYRCCACGGSGERTPRGSRRADA